MARLVFICLFLFITISGSLAQELISLAGKSTSQSTTAWAGPSERAIDGKTNGDYFGGNTCTHTNDTEPFPWWMVDLGNAHKINSVRIYNRNAKDCCDQRLARVSVAVSASPLTGENTNEDLASFPQCGRNTGKAPAVIDIACTTPLIGQYVYVYLPDITNNGITLCEVEIAGMEDPDDCLGGPCLNGGACADDVFNYTCTCAAGYTGLDCETGDIPLVGKPVTQSSLAWKGDPERAIDQRTGGYYFDNDTCTHTDDKDPYPWWRVDLEDNYRIQSVKIYNREASECCAERLDRLKVAVSDSPLSVGQENTDLDTFPLCGALTGNAPRVIDITCSDAITGRYVYVYLPDLKNNGITLCEVYIVGTKM